MEIFVSLSHISIDASGTATISSPCTTPDLKKLSTCIFGSARFDQEQIGTIATRKGEVRVVRAGEEGAVWLLGDTRIQDILGFQSIMKPMPMQGPTGAGDFYLTLNIAHRPTQFLICRKSDNTLMWFEDTDALTSFYAGYSAKPSVKTMLTGNRGNASVVRSWSGSELDE